MKGNEDLLKWYLRPWAVVVLLFFVLGPFGLPFLYKSPKFNQTGKVILTVLTLLFTGTFVVLTLESTKEIFQRLVEFQALLG